MNTQAQFREFQHGSYRIQASWSPSRGLWHVFALDRWGVPLVHLDGPYLPELVQDIRDALDEFEDRIQVTDTDFARYTGGRGYTYSRIYLTSEGWCTSEQLQDIVSACLAERRMAS